MYRDTTNVEPEMYDYTSNNWSHWNSNEQLKEKFGSCTRKILLLLLLFLLLLLNNFPHCLQQDNATELVVVRQVWCSIKCKQFEHCMN